MGLFSKPGGVIPAQEARQIMERGGECVVLDVRTPAEYRRRRIKGAKLIPVDEIMSRAPRELPDLNVPILVYCQSGIRALTAVKALTQIGYTNVASFGGIADWPYETVRG